MIICTVQFNTQNGQDYKELLDTFIKSININMPEAKIKNILIDAPEKELQKAYFMTFNTIKLDHWVQFLKSVNEPIIFADCDMLLLKSARHAFDISFDVAYTERIIKYKAPLNGGIMFASPTKQAIKWYQKLLDINYKMYRDEKFHAYYLDKYVGMNQAAIGYMLEEKPVNAEVHRYYTREWNAVEGDWPLINENTVFCHLKGKARIAIQRRKYPFGSYRKPLSLFYNYAGIDYEKFLIKNVEEKPKQIIINRTRRRRIRRR